MLDLDSKRWEDLPAAGGNPILVTRLLRSLSERPLKQDWDEVWEQVSHQWTLYPAAYAALPYLLRLGAAQGISTQPDFLLGLGRVAAPLERVAPVPEDLQADFDAALRQGAALALEAAKDPRYRPVDYVCALQAAAALSGRRGPGIELFFSLGHHDPELECPACGAYLSGEMREDGLFFQSVNSRMQVLSNKAKVNPSEPSQVPWDDCDQPKGDFDWLAALCRQAKQEKVLFWVCRLYGVVECPLCGVVFTVMPEIERSHGVEK